MFSHATQTGLSLTFDRKVSDNRCSFQRMSSKGKEAI